MVKVGKIVTRQQQPSTHDMEFLDNLFGDQDRQVSFEVNIYLVMLGAMALFAVLCSPIIDPLILKIVPSLKWWGVLIVKTVAFGVGLFAFSRTKYVYREKRSSV